jgi:signal transduction histidine kinase
LTNVRKHAPGAHTRVLFSYGPRTLDLEVVNEASVTLDNGDGIGPGGHGLVGMRERVRLFDGSFDAEPSADGGFRVHAVLPLSEEPA